MEDLTGLGRIVDSEVARKIYQDAVSPSAIQAGQAAEDLAKALRLFTAPVQLLAGYQDRLARWLEEVRSRVPEERQVEAPSNLAGPVLMNLRFEEESSCLKDMYLNLLTASIDKENQTNAHPGFVKIIEQLSPNEAFLLYKLKAWSDTNQRPCTYPPGFSHRHALRIIVHDVAPEISSKTDSRACLGMVEHLQAFGLVQANWQLSDQEPASKVDRRVDYMELEVTHFGSHFMAVCTPQLFL